MTHTADRNAPVDYGLDRGFGLAMKAARAARGWTQVQLASYADVNAETIHRIERGMNTRISTMEKIRKVLPDLAAGHNGQLTVQLAEAQQRAAVEEQRKASVDALRDQVIHLIRAVGDIEHLQHIRQFTLRQLTLKDLPPPPKSPARRSRRAR